MMPYVDESFLRAVLTCRAEALQPDLGENPLWIWALSLEMYLQKCTKACIATKLRGGSGFTLITNPFFSLSFSSLSGTSFLTRL